jgi:DNA-binding GntR family transcriptional regulator
MTNDSRKEKAYKYLYDIIIKHRILPGDAIVEQDISDTLGISRTPVREALKMLEAEGLVRHIPLRGTIVTEISTQDVEEIFNLRETLEVLALQVAIHEITDEELAEVEKALNSLGPNSAREDFYESDRKLHDAIVRNGRNRRLMQFLNTINSQIERLRQISAQRPKRLESSMQEHLDLLAALKERDFKKTEQMLRRHINNVKESTLDVCKSLWLQKT